MKRFNQKHNPKLKPSKRSKRKRVSLLAKNLKPLNQSRVRNLPLQKNQKLRRTSLQNLNQRKNLKKKLQQKPLSQQKRQQKSLQRRRLPKNLHKKRTKSPKER